MAIHSKLIGDASRNIVFQVWGAINEELSLTEIFDIKQMQKPGLIKIASAWWLLQEKLCLLLWWEEEKLVFPMESRNAIAFQRFIEPPADWGGKLFIESRKFATCEGPAHFSFCLDFDR